MANTLKPQNRPKNIQLKSQWRDGPRIWEVTDATTQGSVEYFHMKLVRGMHPFRDHRVVDLDWFTNRKQPVKKVSS